jgi:hypothetical protein
VYYQCSLALKTLIYQICDAFAEAKPVVVIHYDPSGHEPRPNPLRYLLGRLVHIDIDVAQRELPIFNPVTRCVGEYSFEKLYVA